MPDLFTIAHGAGGLWEVHKWNDDLELNTEEGDGRYWLTSINPGFGSLPDRPERTTPKVGRIGENIRDASPGGITRVYKGGFRADSTPELREMRTVLAAAFAPTRGYGTMDLIPQVPEGDTSPIARFYAVVLSLEIPEEITSGEFEREFTLALRQIDPRVYYLGLAVDETSIYPLAVTNPGDAPVDPLIHIAGASGDVEVTDGTHTLTFQNCPSGTLDIDFLARTAKVGSDNVELVVSDSDWWDDHVDGIAGGATVTITQTGGTSVRVVFVPATWG